MSDFCECGVLADLNDCGLCSVCAAAPHGRECPCDACEEYWAGVCRRSKVAAEAFNRRLVCTCGWTGPWPENHRGRQPTCEINLREELVGA